MSQRWAVSVAVVLCYVFFEQGNSKAINKRPIIGIMTQAITDDKQLQYGNSYLAANYVQYLESAGARVVPVLVNQTDQYYTMMYESLNGILFTGGSAEEEVLLETGLGRAAMHFYNNSIKGYDSKRDYFPMWGTCEGFQLLSMLTARKDLLTNTDTEDFAFPLFLSKGYQKSRLFGPSAMPEDILHMLTKENVTYNNHHWSLTPMNFSDSSELKDFYRVISTNVDDKGVEFISTMEAYKYPIYAVQWHPEKNMYQWSSPNIPHDIHAVRVAQHMANFFVEEARKSSHKFSSNEEEAKHLIYNYNAINVGDSIRDGKQYYFFTV